VKVLLTGGDGFVGRALCRLLVRDHKVSVLDSFRFGASRKNYLLSLGVKLYVADTRNRCKVEQIISEVSPEVVFHLAAIHFIPECEGDPKSAVSTNVAGTINIARALSSNTRLVFASSGAVYAPDTSPHRENFSDTKPCDVYGFSKLHCEHLLKYFSDKNGFQCRIVRLFNVIGPGETNPHVLPCILAQLLRGKRIVRLGNTKPMRDYIHVADAARGFAAMGFCDNPEIKRCDVFNLATSRCHSVEDMVDMLSEIIKDEIRIEIDPKRVRTIDRPLLCADTTKISRMAGWKPRHSMHAALTDAWNKPDIPPALLEKVC
jgi:UDP-glucose 4-epimerase